MSQRNWLPARFTDHDPMLLLDLTLPAPAENLALDEALLDAAEAGEAGEILRLWEPASAMVVIGRSSDAAGEVELSRCEALGIPVLRRSSGGGAIVAGPGCLMYAVVLSYMHRPDLRMLDRAHHEVLSRICRGLRQLNLNASPGGTSDLALGDRKFSGNSLRCKRDHFLYHGTLLYDFPLDLVGRLLRSPPRQPEYRAGRSHGEFLVNLSAEVSALRSALTQVFDANETTADWPRERTHQLVRDRYGRNEWNGSAVAPRADR